MGQEPQNEENKSQKTHGQDSPHHCNDPSARDNGHKPKEASAEPPVEDDPWNINGMDVVPIIEKEHLNKPLYLDNGSGIRVQVRFRPVLPLPRADVENEPRMDETKNRLIDAVQLCDTVPKSLDLKTQGGSTSDGPGDENLRKETEMPCISPEKAQSNSATCIFCTEQKQEIFEATCAHYSCKNCIELCFAAKLRQFFANVLDCLEVHCPGTLPSRIFVDDLNNDITNVLLAIGAFLRQYPNGEEGAKSIETKCDCCYVKQRSESLIQAFGCQHYFCSGCIDGIKDLQSDLTGGSALLRCPVKGCHHYRFSDSTSSFDEDASELDS